MTDLQVKYQTLMEQRRANREQERLKEMDVTSSAALRESQTDLTRRQKDYLDQEFAKLEAEITKIQADTKLSEQKKKESISATVKNWISGITGGLESLSKTALNVSKIASPMGSFSSSFPMMSLISA